MTAINRASGANADWMDASDWSGGFVPGAADAVTIDASGTCTVTITSADAAASLALNDGAATVADTATLALGGALAITAGTFALNAGGTLAGVSYQGTLSIGNVTNPVTNGHTGILIGYTT